jgi:Domain of unknown function (DUF4190)/zinc-ribbon domain
MSFCPSCGNELSEEAQVCPKCGLNLSPIILPPVPGQMGQVSKTSGLAIASLGLGILGINLCGIPCIIGIILGTVAISKINKSEGQLTGKGLAIGGIAFGSVSLVLILSLAAIAIPNFFKFQSKTKHNFLSFQSQAKQTEAKMNLGALFITQIAYFGEYNSFGETFDELAWRPEGNTHYSYFVVDDVVQATSGGPYSLPYVVESFANEDYFQIVAVGNIDNDDTLDVWVIDDHKNLRNVINDVSE